MLGGLADFFGGEGEQEHGRGGAAVGRFGGRQHLFDARLGVAAEHARAVAGDRAQRGVEPVVVRGGDDEPRVARAEGLGVRIENFGGADVHGGIVAGRRPAVAGTLRVP